MDIQAGQTWSVPPHGPDIYVHSTDEAEAAYSLAGHNEPTHKSPLPVIFAKLKRLKATLV